MQVDFFYTNMVVGIFTEATGIPIVPGKYQYMPYRGPGHYDLMIALKSGKSQVCVFDFRSKQFRIVVGSYTPDGCLDVVSAEELASSP